MSLQRLVNSLKPKYEGYWERREQAKRIGAMLSRTFGGFK